MMATVKADLTFSIKAEIEKGKVTIKKSNKRLKKITLLLYRFKYLHSVKCLAQLVPIKKKLITNARKCMSVGFKKLKTLMPLKLSGNAGNFISSISSVIALAKTASLKSIILSSSNSLCKESLFIKKQSK